VFRLSAIVPAIGDESAFEDTLLSVLENRPASCEVIVVCNATFQDKYGLQDEVRLIRVRTARSTWMSLANVGLRVSQGAYTNLVLPGIEVLEHWDAAAIDRLQRTTRTGAVAPLAIDNRTREVHQAIAGLRGASTGQRVLRLVSPNPDDLWRALRIDGPTSWCGFFRRQDLLDLGGWDERLSEQAADLELALRLRRRGLASVCELSSGVVLRQDVVADSPLSARQRGLEMERLFWRHVGRLSWTTTLSYPFSLAAAARSPGLLLGRLSVFGRRTPCWTVDEFEQSTQQQLDPAAGQSQAA